MFSSQLRYFIYGSLLSASLISLSVSAGTADGVFGEYFNNIIKDSTNCGINTAITGFTATAGASFGAQRCTTFQNIVKSVLGTSSAIDGQAVVGFNLDGSPKYGDVNWKNSGGNISYTGGAVGIGTATPTAKLQVTDGAIQIDNPAVPMIFNETDQGAIAGKYWRTVLDGTSMRFDADQSGNGSFTPYITPLTMTAAGNITTNGTISAGTTSSRVYLNDSDESWWGAKSIHANSNVMGFLNGQGAWMVYWDHWGNQQNIGNITANGAITASNSQFIVSNDSWGIKPNFPSGWSMVTQGYGGLNGNPQDANGSIHVNDIYIRSTGKWASQMGGGAINSISLWSCTENHGCDDGQRIDGSWASIGCNGQISGQSTCLNVWWSNGGRGCRNACTQIQ